MTHYFDAKPKGRIERLQIRTTIRGQALSLVTARGLFSPEHVDHASALLAEESDVPKGSRVLDLGCGYGVIGIAIAKADPSATVVLSDVNQRAVGLAAENCTANGVTAETVVSNGMTALVGREFDVVLVNPPFAAGKETWMRMLRDAWSQIVPGGSLQAVAPTKSGGSMVERLILELAGNCEILGRQSGFRIYCGRKK